MAYILTVPITYPIISGILSLLISLFGLFSPFICTEREFINDVNWYLSKLRGLRIDKLKGFISETFNINIANDSLENSSKLPYIIDIYECFVDDIEEIIFTDNELRKYLNKYRLTNTSFMIVLWFSVASIVISLICNHVKLFNGLLNYIFYFTVLLVVIQLANIIYLRYLCIHTQDTYQQNIFRGKQK